MAADAGSGAAAAERRVQRLVDYVAIPSLSRQEHALAERVAADLAAAGLAVQRQGNNLWCEIGDAPRPRLLLNSHLDTVPPGDGWTHDPWQPAVSGGRISGLGSNDAKGCVVALLEAFLEVQRALARGEPLGGTLLLALTAEEENSGQGLETILGRLQAGGPLDGAIVGEPTELVPMTAQRGLLILRCTARGRTSHPANTPGDTPHNAIANAAADILRLRSFDWGPPHALLGACHAQVTMIQGGVARNVVPDACEFYVDVRTTPGESHAALTARLRAALACQVDVHSERLVPVETAADARIVQAVLAAAPGRTPAGSPAMSDMVFLAGVPAVKIGPGSSPRSHTPNEYLRVDELDDGARTYARIVRAFFEPR